MASCRPPASRYWQLQQGDPYGPQNCAAYQAALAIAFETCGAQTPTGRQIRAWSNEPIPDPKSPGLNLYQLASVMATRFGIHPEVRIDAPWSEYVAAVMADRATILSVGYDPIRRSVYRGSRVFTGGHAIGGTGHFYTYDSLADGRLLGQGYRAFTGPAYYPQSLLQSAAGQLPITPTRRAGFGRAWFLAMPSSHPEPKPLPPGKEEPLNATTQKPIGACAVKAGVTVYKDELRKEVLYANYGGSASLGLYSRPVTSYDTVNKRYNLAAVRMPTATDGLHVAYVGDDAISNVRLA